MPIRFLGSYWKRRSVLKFHSVVTLYFVQDKTKAIEYRQLNIHCLEISCTIYNYSSGFFSSFYLDIQHYTYYIIFVYYCNVAINNFLIICMFVMTSLAILTGYFPLLLVSFQCSGCSILHYITLCYNIVMGIIGPSVFTQKSYVYLMRTSSGVAIHSRKVIS